MSVPVRPGNHGGHDPLSFRVCDGSRDALGHGARDAAHHAMEVHVHWSNPSLLHIAPQKQRTYQGGGYLALIILRRELEPFVHNIFTLLEKLR